MTQKRADNQWWMASIVGEIGFLIAIPLVIFALGGRAVDAALGSSPLFFLIGIFLAITFSTYIVYRKTSELLKEAENDNGEVQQTPRDQPPPSE